jgi:hypothetical protein
LLGNSLGAVIISSRAKYASVPKTFTADGIAFSGRCRLAGVSVSGTGTYRIFDNTAASGTDITGTLSAAPTMTQPIACAKGIFVDIVSGSPTVIVYVQGA